MSLKEAIFFQRDAKCYLVDKYFPGQQNSLHFINEEPQEGARLHFSGLRKNRHIGMASANAILKGTVKV